MTIETHPSRPPASGTGPGPHRRFTTARTAGVLYVIIIACGLFAELGVRSRLIEQIGRAHV